jgi:uncharacterized protein
VAQPLMPHATASWMVDNTALSFEQIAKFCGLHILEVQAIADDTAATKLTGRDPIRASEITQAEIERGQNDPNYVLKMDREPKQSGRINPMASRGSSAIIPKFRMARSAS